MLFIVLFEDSAAMAGLLIALGERVRAAQPDVKRLFLSPTAFETEA